MFELIQAHLKKIDKNELLPAGIIMTGGGSGIINIADFAKNTLQIPSRIAQINFPENERGRFRDSLFSVAYGLCIIGINRDDDEDSFAGIIEVRGNILAPLKNLIKKFLP